MKKALITGITGQDGAWLAKLLLDNGYKVYGGARRTSNRNINGLKYLGIEKDVEIVEMDLIDYSNIKRAITTVKPDEIYNLAAQSFVGVSFEQPVSTTLVNAMGTAYLLDIIHNFLPTAKFYQASTSELYGKVTETPQDEETRFHPRSPYAVAKLYAHWATINYRESYDMFSTAGILFNHESELRGPEFVTRKITMHVAKVSKGSKDILKLGNLDAKRDWGYAKDYVEGMYKIMQHSEPDVFVLATGTSSSVRQFVEFAYGAIGKELKWEGKGEQEKGYDKKTGELLVEVDPRFFRPAEVMALCGDPSKAKKVLGWEAKTTVEELAGLMVENDISLLK